MGISADNRSLLDAYRRGEEAALAWVYDDYARVVVDVLRHGFSFQSGDQRLRFRGFSDSLELESFVQEVFLKAFSEKARLAYDGLRPFEPYLLTIARNVAIDELRRRRKAADTLVSDAEDELGSIESGEPLPDEQAEANRIRATVREHVETLDELSRRYVRARFEQDRTLLAAARELGISRMRARLLERRVLMTLRKHLQRAGYGAAGAAFDTLTLGLL